MARSPRDPEGTHNGGGAGPENLRPTGTGGGSQTWDYFVRKVRLIASAKGIEIAQRMREKHGTALDDLAKGRTKGVTTAQIEKYAAELAVSPSELVPWERPAKTDPHLRRLVAVANIACHLYVAMDTAELDGDDLPEAQGIVEFLVGMPKS